MLGIREAAQGGLLELATDVLAVALASVVRATDDELLRAVAAGQLEDNELVHPSRTGENWTATSGTTTVSAYWRVHPPLVHRGLRWRPGPSFFPSDVTIIGADPTAPPLSELRPGPPVIPVDVVPSSPVVTTRSSASNTVRAPPRALSRALYTRTPRSSSV